MFKKRIHQRGIVFLSSLLMLSGQCRAADEVLQGDNFSGHASNQALAQLRDIHLPSPIGWWPLAPGWYVFILFAIAMLGMVMIFLWRSYLNGQARRQALRLLSAYQQQYEREKNAQRISACISELLKRVALVYFPRKKVASLQGDAWISFLNETGKDVDFSQIRSQLLELPYQHKMVIKESDLSLLFNMAKKWINQRRKACLN
ncbi:DUF4381 domain-containing protein [Legionella nagasakiensis]|uniref:DUF4381 domain-containing protein n=1 Tax=Legionella nagasakiensis TaxID=535290 RepID=UPI001F5EC147|nr:DUF4381 domain-containing protein [Legionella nagasakiensis]